MPLLECWMLDTTAIISTSSWALERWSLSFLGVNPLDMEVSSIPENMCLRLALPLQRWQPVDEQLGQYLASKTLQYCLILSMVESVVVVRVAASQTHFFSYASSRCTPRRSHILPCAKSKQRTAVNWLPKRLLEFYLACVHQLPESDHLWAGKNEFDRVWWYKRLARLAQSNYPSSCVGRKLQLVLSHKPCCWAHQLELSPHSSSSSSLAAFLVKWRFAFLHRGHIQTNLRTIDWKHNKYQEVPKDCG